MGESTVRGGEGQASMKQSPCADFPRNGTGKARCEPEPGRSVSKCAQ